jgi:hypothetical protein
MDEVDGPHAGHSDVWCWGGVWRGPDDGEAGLDEGVDRERERSVQESGERALLVIEKLSNRSKFLGGL